MRISRLSRCKRGYGNFVRQNRMTGGDGLYLPGGIQRTEMPVVPHKERAADLCLFTRSRNYALANSIEHEFGGIMQIQFLQDVTAMGLDGVGADIESCRDFFVRLP